MGAAGIVLAEFKPFLPLSKLKATNEARYSAMSLP